jgi:hypothetical protein
MTQCDVATQRGALVKKLAWMLASIYSAWGQIAVADEFQKVRCGSDIPKAMIGQRSSNETIVKTEKRYQALGLKHLGADEISDNLSSINWRICGAEYIALVDRHGLVGDVMPLPQHSKQSPVFSGICQIKGRDLPDMIFATLDGGVATDPLPVLTAWKIDQQHAKFIKLSSEGILCPRSGIYTIDGGQ